VEIPGKLYIYKVEEGGSVWVNKPSTKATDENVVETRLAASANRRISIGGL